MQCVLYVPGLSNPGGGQKEERKKQSGWSPSRRNEDHLKLFDPSGDIGMTREMR